MDILSIYLYRQKWIFKKDTKTRPTQVEVHTSVPQDPSQTGMAYSEMSIQRLIKYQETHFRYCK